MTNDDELQVWEDSRGYTKCADPKTGDIVSVDRLVATLSVDDLDDLSGKDVHHRVGWPVVLGLESIEVLNRSDHIRRHTEDRLVSPSTVLETSYEGGDGSAPGVIMDIIWSERAKIDSI